MNKRLLSLGAAGVAATMVLAACSGSVGGDTTTSSTTSSAASSGGSSDTAASDTAAADGPIADTITVGLEQVPGGYNCGSSGANSVYCQYADNLTQTTFAQVQPDASIKPNASFGSYKKTSDDPLTVELTIADDAVWSDGVPIDYDDVLLWWASRSNSYPSGTNDDDGNPIDEFIPASTNGFSQIEMPTGAAGDKTVSLVFTEVYADWEALLTEYFMPAHIVAEQAGLSSADNGAELIAALTDKDAAKVKAIGAFWSTGFDYPVDLPSIPDVALQPSSGPYKVASGEAGALTLVKNDAYWGEPGKTDTFIMKFVDDQEWVQAMANGEIDQFDPSNPTGDTVAQLDGAAGAIEYSTGEGFSFSHVDFNSGPGGGLENILVRQAFLKCMPRQELVDKYAKPVLETAQVLNLREFLPAQSTYEEVLAQVPSAKLYENVDLEGAKALLAQAGVTTPYPLRLTFSGTSSTRADQAQVIKASCDQAGFSVEPKPDPDVFTTLALKDTSWDAALFGWAGSGQIASGQSIYVTNGNQNYGRYSSTIVDDAWSKAVSTTDREEAEAAKIPMEEELWANPYNAVLYASPDLSAYSSKLSGIVQNPTQYGSTWNAATWTKAAS